MLPFCPKAFRRKFEMPKQFLTGVLGVDKAVAEQDACAMEHVISVDSLCAICRFARGMKAAKEAAPDCPVPLEAERICLGKRRISSVTIAFLLDIQYNALDSFINCFMAITVYGLHSV
jgi:hypothetical protein